MASAGRTISDAPGRPAPRPTSRQILIAALKAWAVGLAVAGALLMPVQWAYDVEAVTDLPLAVATSLAMIPNGVLVSFFFGGPLTVPLFAVGLGTALVARGAVPRHPVRWAALAAGVAVSLYAGADAVLRTNLWARATPFPERVWTILRGEEVVLVALSVLAAALFYAWTLGRAVRRAGPGA